MAFDKRKFILYTNYTRKLIHDDENLTDEIRKWWRHLIVLLWRQSFLFYRFHTKNKKIIDFDDFMRRKRASMKLLNIRFGIEVIIVIYYVSRFHDWLFFDVWGFVVCQGTFNRNFLKYLCLLRYLKVRVWCTRTLFGYKEDDFRRNDGQSCEKLRKNWANARWQSSRA